MSGKRSLIVNADDFGRSPGITSGIVKAHVDGIVTSTTLMVNLPWSIAAVEAASQVPDLAIGLHLNYCYGQPVAEVETVGSLVDCEGNLVSSTGELKSKALPDQIWIETIAQLRRFEQLTGTMPSHLDSHKYLHSSSSFRNVVAKVASSCGLPIRSTCENDRKTFHHAGVRTTESFIGAFHGLDGQGVSLEIALESIRSIPDGVSEFMCHPGYVDEHILDSSYTIDRERELDVLCSPELREALDQQQIKLVTFNSLSGVGN